MRDSKIKIKFRVIVHTAQMLSKEMPVEIEVVNAKPYIIKPKVRQTTKGYLYPVNANKVTGADIDSLTEFLGVIGQIQAELGITEWRFDRIDVAFDTTLKYDEIYKYSLYIMSLISTITGIKNAIDIQDVNTKQKRALTVKKDGHNAFEFTIYNKALESDNKHPYSRFEFRYKNITDDDIYTVIDRLESLIERMTEAIEAVEKQRIDALYALWLKENNAQSSTQIKTFSEFVRRYSNDIFTRNIAKGLYYKINSGNFTEWLKWFRRNNKISFIEKSEIEDIATAMKDALKQYI